MKHYYNFKCLPQLIVEYLTIAVIILIKSTTKIVGISNFFYYSK